MRKTATISKAIAQKRERKRITRKTVLQKNNRGAKTVFSSHCKEFEVMHSCEFNEYWERDKLKLYSDASEICQEAIKDFGFPSGTRLEFGYIEISKRYTSFCFAVVQDEDLFSLYAVHPDSTVVLLREGLLSKESAYMFFRGKTMMEAIQRGLIDGPKPITWVVFSQEKSKVEVTK